MISWDDYNEDAIGAGNATAGSTAPAEVVRGAARLAESPDTMEQQETIVPDAPEEHVTQASAASETAPIPTPEAGNVQLKAAQAVESLDPAPGLAELEMGAQRIQVDQKRMINCRADLNQLVPFKYDWA